MATQPTTLADALAALRALAARDATTPEEVAASLLCALVLVENADDGDAIDDTAAHKAVSAAVATLLRRHVTAPDVQRNGCDLLAVLRAHAAGAATAEVDVLRTCAPPPRWLLWP